MKKVHVVPHTHWDREWYFTTSRSKVYLMHDFKRVIELLEDENGYDSFLLDGQASLLDDYLKWRPQDKHRIESLVKKGKLIIGPWYTQTDQLVISGESIIRNMQYGMRICSEFGGYMPVGYVPDSFGQSSSMPQIYLEFGIKDTMFWRGVSDDEVKKTEYRWKGEDGSIVNVFQIPSGYYIGGAIPEDSQELATYLKQDPFKKTWARSSTNHVFFPNGFDQAPPRENLLELIARMNELYKDEFELEISTIENYINAIKNENPDLEEISGELINGKLMRIHKTIFSSRSDLKQLNTQTQNYLVNIMEPILSISMSLGFEYPVETVREIWKLMFENAAHDSIGSCVSDSANEDIYMRYKQIRDISENLIELTMRNISMRIDNFSGKEITLTVFNTFNKSRSGIIEADVYLPQEDFRILDQQGMEIPYTILELVDQTKYVLNQGNILNPSKKIYIPEKVYKAKIALESSNLPGLGYNQLTLDLNGSTHKKIKQKSTNVIENTYYKITVNNNGSLDILDKKSNVTYKNQAIIEDNGDDGDSFNYSPPVKDLVVYSTDFSPTITIKESDIVSMVCIDFEMLVPKNLQERSQRKCTTLLPITLNLTIKKDSPVIDFSLQVDNTLVDSHRVCVSFDTSIASKFSTADHQFGVIKRPVLFEKEMSLWEQNKNSWSEQPIAIETCQTFVTLSDENKGVAVVPKGVREYEIIGDDYSIIRLTIFRTYGFMGKENLMYRPGRASGETTIKTPDAQCHKYMTYSFSVFYYSQSFNSSNVAELAKQILSPVQVYQIADFLNSRLIFTLSDVDKTLPVTFSMLETSGDLILSVIKKAEERPGYILRFYNGKYKQISHSTIKFKHKIKLAEKVNLQEHCLDNLDIFNNSIEIKGIDHAKFVTIYIEFENQLTH